MNKDTERFERIDSGSTAMVGGTPFFVRRELPEILLSIKLRQYQFFKEVVRMQNSPVFSVPWHTRFTTAHISPPAAETHKG